MTDTDVNSNNEQTVVDDSVDHSATEPVATEVDQAAETEVENTTPSEDNVSVEEPSAEPDDGRQWYTLQCFSLQEHKVRDRVLLLMEDPLKGKVFRVLLPEEDTVEIKNNKRQERTTKIYPGYVFVQALPDEQTWFTLRQISGVAKLIGTKHAPTPIAEDEVNKILRKVGDTVKKIEVDFESGEVIKVISGPFRGYTGVISEINAERGKLKSKISIFGRETPVELDFDQVEKTVG